MIVCYTDQMDSTQPSPSETSEQADIRLNKDIAAFSYVWIMSVVIYCSRKDSKFAQYHSKQGIVLFLLSIPISFIPHIGTYIMLPIVAGMLLGFLNAASGQYRDVPIVGPMSRGEMSIADLIHLLMSSIKKVFQEIKKYRIGRSAKISGTSTIPIPTTPAGTEHSGQKVPPSATLP